MEEGLFQYLRNMLSLAGHDSTVPIERDTVSHSIGTVESSCLFKWQQYCTCQHYLSYDAPTSDIEAWDAAVQLAEEQMSVAKQLIPTVERPASSAAQTNYLVARSRGKHNPTCEVTHERTDPRSVTSRAWVRALIARIDQMVASASTYLGISRHTSCMSRMR